MRSLAGAIAAIAAACLFASPASAADCPFADAQIDSATTQQLTGATVCLLNQQRTAAGLGPLTASAPLGTTAQRYAEYMVSNEHFAHQDESGGNVVSRVLSADPGLADRWRVLGENLGWGTYGMATPRSMVAGWMNSPTHRDNILYPDFDEIGVGITPGAPVEGRDDALTYATVFGKLAPARSEKAKRRTACMRKARKKAQRARTKAAKVRAAQLKKRCLAKR